MLENALLDFSESISPISVQTMQLVAGDESLQYDYTGAKIEFAFKSDDKKTFHAPAGTLTHKTLGIYQISSSLPEEYPYHWDIPAFRSATLDDPAQAYYLYAVVPAVSGGGTGEFRLEATAKDLRVGDDFYLLVGILNSESGSERSFATLYGYTEILPGRITTGTIISEDGETYFDLENSEIGGNINFKDGLVSGDIGIGNEYGINAGLNGNGGGENGKNLDTDVRIWAGATKENKDEAPFRVLHDGSFVASKATIEGEINATSGKIAGFAIADGRIGVVASMAAGGAYAGLSIGQNLIKFSDEYTWAGIGTNTVALSEGRTVLARFSNATPNSAGTNYGVLIDVTKGWTNIAILTTGNIISNGLNTSYNRVVMTPPANTVMAITYESDKVVGLFTNSSGYLALPSRIDVAGQLGISTTQPFTVKLAVVSSMSSTYTGYIWKNY